MPPQNVAQMLDNSHLEVTFDKFVKYLISEKIVKIGQVENLSIQQLKTVYNLNCKYHEVSFYYTEKFSMLENCGSWLTILTYKEKCED